jgi:hypothetical protein
MCLAKICGAFDALTWGFAADSLGDIERCYTGRRQIPGGLVNVRLEQGGQRFVIWNRQFCARQFLRSQVPLAANSTES